MKTAYLNSWNSGSFLKHFHSVKALFSPCRLCPRECNASRLTGNAGFCGQKNLPRVAAALPHFGEEPPLTGTRGAGTVFFSGCALRCAYCQNYQISQENIGEEIDIDALANRFLDLQDKGCHNLDLVSPTPHLFFIFQALAVAIPKGLRIPIVYNTHGYLPPATLALLDGIVDVYLPDMKYGSNESALCFSGISEYASINKAAIKRMYDQVGPLQVGNDNIARRGLLVRHLILPGHASESKQVLRTLSRISTRIPVSLMAQYRPCHRSGDHPLLTRPITQTEYEEALFYAEKCGFDTLYAQDLGSADSYFPDFFSKDPFSEKSLPISS